VSRVDWVSVDGFRSYAAFEWAPDPGVNLLIGANGAGKTNLLEAIAYLSTLASFRGAPDQALIGDDRDAAVIRAGISATGRSRLVEIEIRRSGPRRVQLDKGRLRRAGDLLGVVRVVAFLPDDLDLVKRGPALRRDLLDDVAVQLWPASHLDQAEYERALRQRNAFLRLGDRDETTLGVWDSKLSQAGGRVVARRAQVIDLIAPLLDGAYADIAGAEGGAAIAYHASWGDGGLPRVSAAEHAAAIDDALEVSRRQDYERKMTTVGPHRDEPGFLLEGHEARAHASQGEQRSLALAVRLACHRAIAEHVGEQPVLLLDDVFSELDPDRAAALAKGLPEQTQTIITSARREDLPLGGRVWAVEGGEVR
jgi:DNA replication and repair protein RecF